MEHDLHTRHSDTLSIQGRETQVYMRHSQTQHSKAQILAYNNNSLLLMTSNDYENSSLLLTIYMSVNNRCSTMIV